MVKMKSNGILYKTINNMAQRQSLRITTAIVEIIKGVDLWYMKEKSLKINANVQ